MPMTPPLSYTAATVTRTATSNWDTAAYDAFIQKPLRTELYADMLATVKPTNQTHNGASVTFNYKNDLAVAITPLPVETDDISPVAMSDVPVTLTLSEYGNGVVTSAKLRGTSYAAVDTEAAETVGRNAGESIDSIIMNVMNAGSNVKYKTGKTTRISLAAADTLTAIEVRYAVAKLKGFGAPRFTRNSAGGAYVGIIHPDVAVDLRTDTGGAAWRDSRQYVDPSDMYNGEVGRFEGVDFIETPRAGLVSDAGTPSTVDVYQTLIVGQRALAKVWSRTVSGPVPQVVVGPVVDSLMRFHPIGWYWLGAYGRFLENAMYRIETSSSIGVNT